MIKIGLSGGIGSGKSTVAKLFAELNVAVISADEIAHRLTNSDSPQLAAIKKTFGKAVFQSNGRLDRNKLAQLVFDDTARKKQLEQILHPPIRSIMQREAESSASPYVLMEVPLLIESEQYRDMDRVLIVTAPLESRMQRLAERSGMDAQQVELIIAQQASDQERLALADDVIDNSAGLNELAAAVDRLHQQYLALSENN